MSTLSDLLPDFLEHLEVERGRSQRTTKDYEHYLTRFIELAGEISGQDYDLKPGDLTRELIRKYRLRLNRITDARGHTLAPITQAYHLIALRGFLKYLAQRDIATLDPSLIELPRVVRKQVTFLNYDEVERLLAEIPTDTETGLRDRAIIELLFSGGLRVSELAGLNRDSINLERREFMVRGKGSKDRPIFISESAADHIQAYLDARSDRLAPLFLSYSRRQGDTDTSGNFRRLTTRSIERIVQKYARAAGITEFRAGVLPQDKAFYVKELQAAGHKVAMAGDGINDSAALAQADLSIAMGGGSDIAIDTAMITILSSDLTKIPEAVRLSQLTIRTIRQNLFWAFIYNIIAVPVAAGILYPVNGFLLNPMIGGAAMALSSVSVVTNSLRLRGRKL